MHPPHPSYLPPERKCIPGELRDRSQWVVWRAIWREGKNGKPGKWAKVPFNARTGRKASATSPATWSSFDQALQTYEAGNYDGIGYVFAADDPYCGVDLDACRDPGTGVIDAGATEIVASLSSYTELSVSGTGTHTIVRGRLPGAGCRKDHVEMYDAKRYFCFTGHVIDGCPLTVEGRQEEIEALHARVFGATPQSAQASTRHTASLEPDDERLLTRARAAKNGAKFEALYVLGDTSGYASASEADLALCSLLRFWTGDDAERIDRLYRGSALMRPKWDSKRGDTTYGAQTVAKALITAPPGPGHPPGRRSHTRPHTSRRRGKHGTATTP